MNLQAKTATVEAIAVWRAAQDVIARFPNEPELAACQIADDALAAGNMWEFKLWQRVAKAVRKLVRKASRDGNKTIIGRN